MATSYFYTQDGVILSELVLDRPGRQASWRELGGYPRTLFDVKVRKRPGGEQINVTDEGGGLWVLTPLTDIAMFNAAARSTERPQYESIAAAVDAYKASLEDRSTIARDREDRFSYDEESFAQLQILRPET
jgi:hypothetical protein